MEFSYKKLLINGQLKDASGKRSKEVICPATGEKVAEVAWAGKEDALQALAAADQAFKSWSALTLQQRKDWMLRLRGEVIKNQEILRLAVMHETGKTWNQTMEDYETVVNALEWYPNAMGLLHDEILPDPDHSHHHQIITQPAGVVVAYLAWNFPLLNVGFKIGPALAAGCSIIIKPSSSSPLSAYILGEIIHDMGFPAGVINILAGPNDEVGELLSSSSIPAVITMIGSTATGKKVISDSVGSIKRMSMELGGNAPFIVFEDADTERAAEDLKNLKYGNCGQVCVSPNRIFVHEKVYKEFMAIFLDKVKKLKLGFGKDESIDMGPMISESALAYVEYIVQEAEEKGAKILLGGKRPKEFSEGYYYEPTIVENLTPDMKLFRQEIFGPVAAVMSFSDDDAVLELANDTEYGLASYIYTNNSKRIDHFTRELGFGEVQVNSFKYAIYLPHGGIKQSGIGHDCSHLALHDYLVKKRITTLI